jgi:hypothetical protein
VKKERVMDKADLGDQLLCLLSEDKKAQKGIHIQYAYVSPEPRVAPTHFATLDRLFPILSVSVFLTL